MKLVLVPPSAGVELAIAGAAGMKLFLGAAVGAAAVVVKEVVVEAVGASSSYSAVSSSSGRVSPAPVPASSL